MQSDGCYSSGFVLITRQKHLQYVKKLQWYTYLVIRDYILYFLLVSNKFKKFCLKNCFHLSLLGTYFSDVKSVYRSIEQFCLIVGRPEKVSNENVYIMMPN